jgi:hypothetical protein
MPQTKLFFVMQSPFRIDDRPPDGILSTKVSLQLSLKRTNMNPSLSITLKPGARCPKRNPSFSEIILPGARCLCSKMN